MLLLCCASAITASAAGTIKGRVVDKTTHEPIEAAVVINGQAGNTEVTDKNGSFVIHDVKGDSLYVMVIGYK